MNWWTEKHYRMIQNNLRDVDAGMDVDRYVEDLQDFGANVCMVGCGGITAFHPSELDCQTCSPYLRDDFFGRLLNQCHEKNIRVIARFDFSKTHIRFLDTHPEWFSCSLDGEPILYHDTVASCVNGAYQQERSFDILEEVIRRYPVDGVFFNMFGYQTRDYNGTYVGICQCENCRRRFGEYGGLELPVKEDPFDPVYIKYQEFKSFTTEELLQKIYLKVKSLNPETAVCTYSSRGVDLVRNESNSAVDRPLPFWFMASEYNTEVVRGTFSDRVSSNCVINAVDIFYRFMGVSPYLNELRLYGNMAAGGNLDWCIIGGFETYPDKTNFEGTKRVFRFHQKYEKYLNSMKSCASILLINPVGHSSQAKEEFLGLYKILKESHMLFDVLDAGEIRQLEERADGYDMIVLPALKDLPDRIAEALERSHAIIVGTGAALKEDSQKLQKLFHLKMGNQLEHVRGSYMLTEPKTVFHHFADRDWVYLDQDYYYILPDESNSNYMPLISSSMYGPPERCFGHEVTEQSCISVRKGKAIYFPWMIGGLYYKQGYEDFKHIFMDVVECNTSISQPVHIEAPPCVEIFMDRCGIDQYLIQILNYSGFNGTTFYEPLPVLVRGEFHGICPVKAQILTDEGKKGMPAEQHWKLQVKGLYQAILFTVKSPLPQY